MSSLEPRPDVVCLQEVFVGKVGGLSMDGNVRRVCNGMESLGYVALKAASTSPWFLGQDDGLLTFLLRSAKGWQVGSFQEVAFAKSDEYVCNKGYSVTVISLGKEALVAVVNTHLSVREGEEKASQVEELGAIIDDLEKRSMGIVLLGDFNIAQQPVWDDGRAYVALSRRMEPLWDCFGEAQDITFEQDEACYDHVFTNGIPISKRILGSGPLILSDHNAVMVDLDFACMVRRFREGDEASIRSIFSANVRSDWSAMPEYMGAVNAYVESSCASDLAHIEEVYFARGDGYFWVVVQRQNIEEPGVVVGFVGMEVLREANMVELRRMHIKEGYRGSGLGRHLVQRFLRRVATMPRLPKRVTLSTPLHNTRAIAFYQSLGFTEFGERDFIHGTDKKQIFLNKMV